MSENHVTALQAVLQRHALPGDSASPARGGIWLLQSGSIDFFLQLATPGLPHPVREFFCSLQAGQMLAMPTGDVWPDDGSVELQARIAAGSRFWVLPPDDLPVLLAQPASARHGAALLGQLRLTLAALLPPLATGNGTGNAAGNGAGNAAGNAAENAVGNVAGSVAGNAAENAVGNVAGKAAGEVAVESGPEWPISAAALAGLGAGPVLAAVEQLWQDILQHQTMLRQQREIAELDRLQRKAEAGRERMNHALSDLASLFDDDTLQGSMGDAMALACHAIGKQMGVNFVLPPTSTTEVLERVYEIAAASGLGRRKVMLKGEWWHQDSGPLLAFSKKERTPLALIPCRGGGYVVVQAGVATRQKVDAAFAAGLGAFGYMFYRNLPSHALQWRDLVRFSLSGMRGDLLAIALAGIASAMLAMVLPIASGHLFDNVFPAADRTQLLQVVFILFVAGGVKLLFEATGSLLMLRLEGRAANELQAAVWDRVLRLPAAFFRAYAAGDLANRIDGINEIRQALSGRVISSLLGALFSLLNVALMVYYSARLALLALALVLLMLLVNGLLAWCQSGILRESGKLNGIVSGRVLEYLSGISKIRVSGAESRAFANWATLFGQQKRLSLRGGQLANLSTLFSTLFPLGAGMALFWTVAVVLPQDPGSQAGLPLSTGDFIAFSAVFGLFMNAMLSLMQTLMILIRIEPLLERTRPILQALPEVNEHKHAPGRLAGGIELSHVSFAYAADAPLVLNDVSIRIRPGEFVALVGASGSGKSTLLRLLLGFEKPQQGGIYYDGQNLQDVDAGAVRRQLGVVLQGGRLLGGDIFTNIVGATLLTLEDAWAAARACGLDQDIRAMPMGMQTVVSEGGTTLSGGQRQRLQIARAIVHRPGILFFDEATSALDNATQAIVSDSMERLHATRVVIAHRLSTIMNADRIFVLDQGRVVQSGNYQELMAQDGLFAELAQRQIV